ncbi:MAG: hypothetical protein AB8E82_18075 [Aureispira sp.]
MTNDDLLDDGFGVYKAALSAEELKSLEGKIPYSILRGDALADVCALLDEHEIEYTLQSQPATMNGTGIIPLASTQLNMVDTLVYIQGAQKAAADQLVESYEQQLQVQAEQAPKEDNFKQFYWLAALLLALLIFSQARQSGMF